MNKILLLAIFCVASANCVTLENICSSDTFEYKSAQPVAGGKPPVLVNAFHRVQLNATFESLSHYLINDTVKCDIADFKIKANFWEALKLKRQLYVRRISNQNLPSFQL